MNHIPSEYKMNTPSKMAPVKYRQVDEEKTYRGIRLIAREYVWQHTPAYMIDLSSKGMVALKTLQQMRNSAEQMASDVPNSSTENLTEEAQTVTTNLLGGTFNTVARENAIVANAEFVASEVPVKAKDDTESVRDEEADEDDVSDVEYRDSESVPDDVPEDDFILPDESERVNNEQQLDDNISIVQENKAPEYILQAAVRAYRFQMSFSGF